MQETDIRKAPIETLKAKKVGNKYIIIGRDEKGIPIIIEKNI